MYIPMQVMDLQVKYHYYTMCTLQDMDLNQSVTDRLFARYGPKPKCDIQTLQDMDLSVADGQTG